MINKIEVKNFRDVKFAQEADIVKEKYFLSVIKAEVRIAHFQVHHLFEVPG